MVTTLTYTVGGGTSPARDYSTIALAEADLIDIMETEFGAGNTNMVTEDAAIIFELYQNSDTASLVFAESVTISTVSLTTGVDNYVTFRAVAADRHDGTRLSGIRVAPTSGHAFTVAQHHVHFDRLEIVTGDVSSDECVHLNDFGSGILGVTIENCILEPNATQTSHDGVYAGNYNVGSATYPILVRNCLGHGFDRAGVHPQNYSTSGAGLKHYFQVVNCTFVDCDYGIGWQAKNAATTVYVEHINCIGGKNTSSDLGESATSNGTLDTTGSSDNFGEADGAVGASSNGSFADNTAITLTDSTAGGGVDCIVEDVTGADYTAWDLRLVDHANNDAQDGGIGPSSESLVALYDAIGEARSGTTTDPGYTMATSAPPATRRVFVIS